VANLLHNVVIQNQDNNADGILTFDLGVNPLSMLWIAIRPLNDTGTLSNFVRWFEACQAINKVTVLFRGQSILSMKGEDAAAIAVMRHGFSPWAANADNTNNERLCMVLPIFLGRRAFDPQSAFPASRRGDLVLELDVDDADTGYDDLQFTVEATEILGASPNEFERKVQLPQTFSATGINDVDMPLGNIFRGAMLFGTSGFGGASPSPTWGRVQLVADGVGIGYSSSDFEVLHAMTGWKSSVPVDDHIHAENDTGGPTDNAHNWGLSYTNYALLDLDPWMNDAFSIDTKQVSRLQIRGDAEAAEAVRVIPFEKMTPKQLEA